MKSRGTEENNWQGNCSVGQVINSPEILCIYRAHLSTIVDKILAADILCEEEKLQKPDRVF